MLRQQESEIVSEAKGKGRPSVVINVLRPPGLAVIFWTVSVHPVTLTARPVDDLLLALKLELTEHQRHGLHTVPDAK